MIKLFPKCVCVCVIINGSLGKAQFSFEACFEDQLVGEPESGNSSWKDFAKSPLVLACNGWLQLKKTSAIIETRP